MMRLLLSVILILVPAMNLLAEQRFNPQEQADLISSAIKVPLYGYDMGSVASVIETMIRDKDVIRAVDIFDLTSGSVIFESYKTADNTFHSKKPIPEEQKNGLKQFTYLVVHDQEEIAKLRLYYLPGAESALKLTTEERAWIKENPELRIGNEMDWPPFDFAEDGKPMGYSIDFIELVAHKVGLKTKFVNGYTWVELVDKLKAGQLDALPAIYKTKERESFLAFTSEYFSQPSVIVVNSGNQDIKTLQDLSGRRLAAIKGFAITEVMSEKHPEIELYQVDALLDGILAVSTGQADAFIDSIGNISYLIQKNFIPNVKFISDKSLREVENPSLYIAVPQDRKILRDIIQKGMQAVTEEEKRVLTTRWLGVFDSLDKTVSIAGLTKKESDWIAEHPTVRLGVDPAWPPLDFIESGEHRGIAADVLKLLSAKLGITFELARNLSWTEVLDGARNRTVDVISFGTKTPQRSEYLLFSDPVEYVPWVIVARSGHNQLADTVGGLNGKKVAMVTGYTIYDLTRDQYPEFPIIEVGSPLEGLKAVESGNVDAYVGNLAVISHLMKKEPLRNLTIVSHTEFEVQKLSIAVRSDWPELHGIINKGLKNIPHDEILAIRNKWIPVDLTQIKTEADSSQEFLWIAVVIVSTLLALLVLGALVSWASKSEQVDLQFGTRKFRWITLFALGLFIAVVILTSWLILERNKQRIIAGVENNLRSTLRTTWERMHVWVEGKQNIFRQLGRDPKLVNSIVELIERNDATDQLITNYDMSKVPSVFLQLQADIGDFKYLIVDGNAINIAASNRALIGDTNELFGLKPGLLKLALDGETIFVPPVHLDSNNPPNQDGNDDILPTMYLAGPLRKTNGEIVAVMLQQIDPSKGFSKVLQFSRVGESGESYAFNIEGRLLSESRFDDQLREIGLIAPDDHGILTIEIRDPGGNMLEGFRPTKNRTEQPLTLMARNAIAMRGKGVLKGQGNIDPLIKSDLVGYHDYRGVPVVGAWLWDDDFDFGMVSEMDVSEALSPYKVMRLTVVGILGFTLLILVGITFFVLLIGERTSRVLLKARDDLEDKVQERTAELEENRDRLEQSEERSRLLLESVGEGIFGVGADGLVNFINPAGLSMVGYSADEVIGKKIHPIIHHSHADNTPYPVVECPMYQSFTEGISRQVNDEVLWHKDGTSFPVEYSSVPILKGDEVVGSVVIFRDITKRLAAEADLRKLSLVVEQSQISVVITDLEGTIEYVNPSFTHTTGYSLEEAIGQNPRILNAGIQPPEFYREMWETIISGDVWQGEFANKTKGGDIFWENATISPIWDESGQVTHLVAVKEDITERRAAEQALRESANRHRTIFESSPLGMLQLDPEGVIINCNQMFADLMGSDMAALIGFNSYRSAGDRKVREAIGQALEGRTSEFEGLYTSATGQKTRFLRMVFNPVDPDNSPSEIIASVEDISERKRAEEALRESEETMNKITSSALSAIIMLDAETGKVSFWNETAIKIFGWSFEEVWGKKLEDFIIPAKYRNQHIDAIKRFSKTGEGSLIGHAIELSALNRHGEEFPVELRLSSVKLKDRWHAIGLVTDITERKEAERELQKAKEIAEEATRAKSDFLANMSHEIRTPMNAIIGLSHLCLGTELQSRQRDYIEKVYQSSQSLLGIINDILDFSKIEAGKLVIESIPFRLDEVLDNLGNLIAIKAQEKGLELLFDTHPDVPSALVGDPLRLGQILLNLAGNAVKFTEKGEIVIHTESVRIAEDEVEIRVSVQDTGIGMTQEQCDRMFQSFSQADTSTTRKYGGTGLGLAISKKLTELMGGHIWVESESGVGSAFIFTAIFGRASDMEKTLHKATPTDLDQLKVLVVDDVASTREMLAATLSAFSFRVTCVNSGQDALAALEGTPLDDPFKLVLMDWKMPGMDGIEATERIKNHPALHHIPTIIMITAYGREEAMQQAETVGLEGFLIKPITPSTLLDTIMGVLGEKGGFRGAALSDEAWKIKPIDGIRGAHVLLAEDNKINQQVAQELLGQAGVNVTIANNGKEAVDWLKKTTFDAVLMDMQMPEMDGYEATRTIRRMPEFSETPIIAMTANVMAGDREKCLEAGMNDHVAKPIDPDKLFSTLVEWITPRAPVGHPTDIGPSVSVQANEIFPAELEGVDIGTGLKRVGGNRKFYRKLLVDFYQDHRKDGQSIREAITADHLDVATRVAHTIKGVSGSIGAAELQRDAEKLEAALKGRDTSSYDNLLSNLDQSLDLVMQGLSVLSTAPKREEAPPDGVDMVDLDSIRPLLEQIHLQLEEMDPDAEETAALLIDKLGAGPQHNLLTALKKQVDDFEFEAALETLIKLRDKLEDTTETG